MVSFPGERSVHQIENETAPCRGIDVENVAEAVRPIRDEDSISIDREENTDPSDDVGHLVIDERAVGFDLADRRDGFEEGAPPASVPVVKREVIRAEIPVEISPDVMVRLLKVSAGLSPKLGRSEK